MVKYYLSIWRMNFKLMLMRVFNPSEHKMLMSTVAEIDKAFDEAMTRVKDDTESHDISFPSEPYALFTEGGGITDWGGSREHNEGEYVVHIGLDECPYVLMFDNLDDAISVQTEYQNETMNQCTIKRTFAHSIDIDQKVRFYHMNGNIYDVNRDNFLKLVKD